MDLNAEKEIKKFEKIKTDHANIKSLWEELAHFFYPSLENMTRYVTSNNDTKKRRLIFDNTAEKASKICAARFMIMMCNPQNKWIKLNTLNKKNAKQKDVEIFLNIIAELALDECNKPKANFYEQIKTAINCILVFGVGGVIIDEEVKDDYIKFRAININNYYYEEDYQGFIKCHYLEDKIKGSDLANLATDGYENISIEEANLDKDYTMIRKIYRNPNYKPDLFNFEGAKWQSVTILKETKKIIKTEFYNECPIAVGRWDKIANSIFPDSIARMILSEVKTLNRIESDILKHNELMLNPPRAISAEADVATLDLSTNGVTVMQVGDVRQAVQSLYAGQVNIQQYEAKAEQKRSAIREAFYLDQFFDPTDVNAGDYTTVEAKMRRDNNLQILAPKITHLQAEFISGIVERVASIAMKKDVEIMTMLTEKSIKPSLDLLKIRVVYENELTTAYRLNELNNILGFVGNVGNVATTQANLTGSAESMDNISFDAIVKEIADIMSVDQKIMVEEEIVQQIRDQKAQQAQEQAEMNTAQQASEIAKNVPQDTPQ